MEISLLALQIGIIFLPGILWARIDSTYGLKTKSSDMEFFMRAFTFGLVSYAVTFFVFSVFGRPFSVIDLGAKQGTTIVTQVIAYEVVCAIGVSFFLAVVWLYLTNYKLLTRLLQAIGATKTYGDEDVWDFTFNSQKAIVEYVHVRDFQNRIVYAGWVDTFSETDKLRELVLSNVQLFDFEGTRLFEVPLVYLARNPENIHIEFPYREDQKRGAR